MCNLVGLGGGLGCGSSGLLVGTRSGLLVEEPGASDRTLSAHVEADLRRVGCRRRR